MRSSVLLLAATSAVVLAQTSSTPVTVTLQSAKNYKLTYSIIDQTSANPTLSVTLSISGFDTSKWTNPDGKTGMYMGLGFGGSTMRNIDTISCAYSWTNKATDAF